jgi:ArsR family transcriptional regulator, lead/cadmium/zinc/bismuth-responsive transcriptional repressor
VTVRSKQGSAFDPNGVALALAALPSPDVLESMAETFQTLGDPTRIKIVLALSAGPLSVSDIAVVVGISESGVSHQLRVLRDRRIVRAERAGQRTYYSVDDTHLVGLLREADFHADHVRSGHARHD